MMKPMKRRRFLESSALAGLLAPVAAYWTDLPEARALDGRKNLVLVFYPNGKNAENPFIARTATEWSFAEGFLPFNEFKSDAIAFEEYAFAPILDARYTGDHGGHVAGAATMFTGEVAYVRSGAGDGLRAPSIDQIVAWEWMRRGEIVDPLRRSLGIVVSEGSFRVPAMFGQVPADYTLGAVYDQQITPVTQYLAPIDGFRQMFGDVAGAAGTTLDALWSRGASVLDLPSREIATLHDQLPSEGKRILDEHLTSLRDLETSLLLAPTELLEPPDPPEDIDPRDATNRVRVFSQWAEIIDMSLRLDRTRIVTITMGGCAGRFHVPELGLGFVGESGDSNSGSDMHSYTHWSPAEVPLFNDWMSARVAELLRRMKGGEGRENILDSSVVMIGTEGGHVHRALDTPVAIFGSGGGSFATGRALTYGNDQAHLHTGTLLSVCHAMGLTDLTRVGSDDERFQRGIVPELFAT
jgi:hypothetical protein